MSHPIEITDKTFEAEVLKSELPTVVDFWAPWCGPCRMMAPVLEELATKYDGKLKITKLNVDEANHQPLAEKYQIQGIPALKVFKGGAVVKELVGYQPLESLEKELKDLVS